MSESDDKKKPEDNTQETAATSIGYARELAQALRNQQLNRKPSNRKVGACEPFFLKK